MKAVIRLALCAITTAATISAVAADRGVLFNGANRAIFPDMPYNQSDRMYDADLETGRITEFNPHAIGAPAGFRPQAISKSGFLLATSGSQLLACDPEKKKTVTVYKARPDVLLGDLAYNTTDGAVLIECLEKDKNGRITQGAPIEKGKPESSLSPLLYVPQDTDKAGFVFCRRVPSVDGFAFAPDGTLYFSHRGDVWAGTIESNDFGDGERNPMPWVLAAERVAPVAILETYVGTPYATGADEVTAGGDRLYIHSRRMGGSGMGDLYSIHRKPANGDQTQDVASYARAAAETLGSLTYIQEYTKPPYLATSPDGRNVFWVVSRTSDSGEKSMEATIVNTADESSRTLILRRD
ncbi:MAG: hypothetical protein K1X53_15160 [Candidatus Sumerlaeaceae bacterium]|nr:hypothetical protein [Candidatus Sumerlaeaceae bacterium]